MHKQGNIEHAVYTPQSTSSNGAGALSGPPGPPFSMVYSYEPGTNHGASSSEPIEFGSLGPLPAADGDDIPRSALQDMQNGFYGPRYGPYSIQRWFLSFLPGSTVLTSASQVVHRCFYFQCFKYEYSEKSKS